MSAVRNLVTDLVDRRLWPVAVALLGALVAVPVLLGGGAAAPAPPAPPAPLAAVPAGGTVKAAISISPAPTGPQYRPGPVRNPFAQHQVKVQPPVTSAPATPASSRPSTPVTSAPSTPVTGTPVAPSAPLAPIVPGKPDHTVANVWRVDLRFGEAGNQKLHRGIARLTPLPSAANPFFIFLGVVADGKTAVFLISSDTTATGDGTCKPTPSKCVTVEMRAGDSEFFDVTQGTSGVTQYELDLLKVYDNKVAGRAAAARASRVNADGQNVLDELKAKGAPTGTSRYIWSARRGVLIRRHWLRAKVTASSASTGLPVPAHSSGVFGVTWTG